MAQTPVNTNNPHDITKRDPAEVRTPVHGRLAPQIDAGVPSLSNGEWPTYNGDLTGRRYSPLTKHQHQHSVKQLELAWTFRVAETTGGGRRISSTPLEVDGVLYFTVPSHVWAVDARTGVKLWQYDWQSQGGEAIGNRGAAVRRATRFTSKPTTAFSSRSTSPTAKRNGIARSANQAQTVRTSTLAACPRPSSRTT